MPPLTPQQLQQVRTNCEALRICFNVLSAVVDGIPNKEYANKITVSIAQKYIYERWEKEKHLLSGIALEGMPIQALINTGFTPHAPFSYPPAPEPVQKSEFFKRVWGKIAEEKWMDPAK
jgi:hypothetical protein